ncbi:hypothetical protein GmHk_17G047685 [Glycine max]|nr:hypothetical protein GmHk_17G047685 [Glycine max]
MAKPASQDTRVEKRNFQNIVFPYPCSNLSKWNRSQTSKVFSTGKWYKVSQLQNEFKVSSQVTYPQLNFDYPSVPN